MLGNHSACSGNTGSAQQISHDEGGLKGCGTEWRVIGGARRHRTRTRVRRPEEERRASTGDTEKRMKAGLMQGEMTMRVIITGIYGAPTACQAHAKNLMSVLLRNSDRNPV